MSTFLSFIIAALPVCNAEVCKDVGSGLLWENDKFGMFAYGPTEYHRWSGLDVFNKSGEGTSCISWLKDPKLNDFFKHPNFHDNRGNGMDNYAMGAARGVGGVALWADGEWKTYTPWIESKIICATDDVLEIELVYPEFSCLGKMTYHITLKRGEYFYKNVVTFEFPERMHSAFRVGPGIDLEPKRGHYGSLKAGDNFVSLFEDPRGADGSTMSAIVVPRSEKIEFMTDHLNCRVLAFKKASFTYYAGASWTGRGEFKSAGDWHRMVEEFASTLK